MQSVSAMGQRAEPCELNYGSRSITVYGVRLHARACVRARARYAVQIRANQMCGERVVGQRVCGLSVFTVRGNIGLLCQCVCGVCAI